MTKLEYALLFVKNGISVFPLRHRGKEPESKLISGQWENFTTEIPSISLLERWLSSEWQNYAVVCGWENLVVIDFDNMDYYNIWMLWASTQHEIIRYACETAFKVKTSRGVHVYVRTLEPEVNGKRIKKKGGIDIQAQRKYIVGPGSVHPSGHVYQAMNEFILPVVMGGIDEILPVELFPLIVAEPETGTMPVVDFAPNNTEYQSNDPFEIASGMSQGVDLIAKVKSIVRIENLFPEARKTSTDGRFYSVKCPFHDDHKPSFWIDTKRQLCGCQTCGMLPMDAINLYSRMHNVTESAAVVEMAQSVGVWR